MLSVSIEDDGIGFDVEKTASFEQTTLGLLIMEERAKQLGGEFYIESFKDSGTHVLIEMPFIMIIQIEADLTRFAECIAPI